MMRLNLSRWWDGDTSLREFGDAFLDTLMVLLPLYATARMLLGDNWVLPWSVIFYAGIAAYWWSRIRYGPTFSRQSRP